MSKFFKAVWSGNITRNILDDFAADIEKKLHIEDAWISQWQSEYGDFNGDGQKDILLSYWGANNDNGKDIDKPSDGQLVLLLGHGKGFTDGTSLLPNDGRLNSMTMNSAVADFNNDGVDDIILTNHNEDGRGNASESTVNQYAFFSMPNGKFEKYSLNFNTWARSSYSGDFNNDGRLDFAVAGWTPQKDGSDTAFYFQNADGTYTKSLSGALMTGNVTASGDFDGDGELEIANLNGYSHNLKGLQSILWELNDDGSIGSFTTHVDHVDGEIVSEDFGGHNSWYGVGTDNRGRKYLDNGLHFADTGDINGDGADDIVAIHYAQAFKKVNGQVIQKGPLDFISIYSAVGGQGMEQLDVKIKGWTPPDGLLNDIHLVDWNGDGHLDIFVPWENNNKQGVSEAERVFLNDGAGNFERLAQKYLPSGNNLHNVEYGDYTDANGDGIMDVLVRPKGIDFSWNSWDRSSETLYLGTKRIFGDGTNHNPAKEGAAGFNEAYYLEQIENGSNKMLRSAGFETALDHYLSVGKASGAFGFAAGSHIYGYGGSETIVLREGDEAVHAMGGDDTITGAAGADILNGGKGADTFVYEAVTDSGTSATTRDVIEDFVSGTDKIDLSGIDAIANTASNDAFTFFKQDGSAFTGKAGELRWYSTDDTGKIIEGDVDGDGVADFQIELLGGGALQEADFIL